MIKIEINGLDFLVKPNLSVLEACKFVGLNIPRFCYHETLSVAGNCRMCLVEIGNSPKPVASCALPVLNNMKIFVDTPLVKKARENVLETLLLNHPLDCPICDQAGECDLQDQTKAFGGDYSRFFFNKRGVEEKYCGPLIKTIMTRCIHCTRCVRYGIEIAGVEYLGVLNRGGVTEIGGYLPSSFNSEISGNVIDLCPVGALTSKPYAFKARPWELRTNESIDLTDSTGSHIYVSFKESEIARITPKINSEINDSIITDKARFSYDSIKNQRLHKSFHRNSSKKLEIRDWSSILTQIDALIKNTKKITFLINDELDFGSLALLKQLTYQHKSIILRSISKASTNSNTYLEMNSNKITDVKLCSRVCLLISSNIRIESAILNTKLRLKYSNEDFVVFGLGQKFNNNFPIQFVNLSVFKLVKIIEAKDATLSKMLLRFKAPLVFFGSNLFKRGLNVSFLISNLKKIVPSAIFFNVKAACNSSSIFALNIKAVTKNELEKSQIIIAVNLDDTFISSYFLAKKDFIWINTHGSQLASKALTIIPMLTEFEEEKIFVNLEGRPQKTFKTFAGIGSSRSLKGFIKSFLNINASLSVPVFYLELLNEPSKFNLLDRKLLSNNLLENKNIVFNKIVQSYPIKPLTEDFHCSNKTTKKSIIMNQCSQEVRKQSNNF